MITLFDRLHHGPDISRPQSDSHTRWNFSRTGQYPKKLHFSGDQYDEKARSNISAIAQTPHFFEVGLLSDPFPRDRIEMDSENPQFHIRCGIALDFYDVWHLMFKRANILRSTADHRTHLELIQCTAELYCRTLLHWYLTTCMNNMRDISCYRAVCEFSFYLPSGGGHLASPTPCEVAGSEAWVKVDQQGSSLAFSFPYYTPLASTRDQTFAPDTRFLKGWHCELKARSKWGGKDGRGEPVLRGRRLPHLSLSGFPSHFGLV